MAERGARFSFAWQLLAFERRRLAAAVAGIAFAVILMLVQMGFYGAMIDSATKVHRNIDAELVLVPAGFEYFGSQHNFARVCLMQAAAVRGVEEVAPMYVAIVNIKDIDSSYNRSIMAIGIVPGRRELMLPGIVDHEGLLMIPGNVLFDRKSLQAYYGDVVHRFAAAGPFKTLVEGHPVKVAGLFDLGTSFVAFGNLVLGTSTFFALSSSQRPELPSFGLIRLKPGVDAQEARARVERALNASDVVVETKQQFVQREIDYWNKTAAIGFIFVVGAAMGVLVGSVVSIKYFLPTSPSTFPNMRP
jgi:putative ABC transport system permease protein